MTFSKDDIQGALNRAIQLTMFHEKSLLMNKCSERAIVHWLANYFYLFVNKKQQYSCNGYVVDVEYNRIGENGEYKTLLSCNDLKCTHQSNCTKRLLENIINKDEKSSENKRILIDMIYHLRGKNTLDGNVFCMEVKTTTVGENDYHHVCDKNRIETLVKRGGRISYQYGATVYFRRSTEAFVRFFDHTVTEPEKYIIYKSGKIERLSEG